MILGSNDKLEIGEVYIDGFVTDATGHRHDMPFKVLAESTFDEWLAYATEMRGGTAPPEITMVTARASNSRFYRVSVD